MQATNTQERAASLLARWAKIAAAAAIFPASVVLAQNPAPAATAPPAADTKDEVVPAAPPEPPAGPDDGVETVYVTGSRIAVKNRKEGPAAVSVITAEDIQKRSLATVSDVLYALPQANTVIPTEHDANAFTSNLNPIDLRGLGPGRTLVLVNGRRVPDYPGAFNAESNAVNTRAIPAVAIERVEVLSGGASAIYGSDAVAGVINIVLKKNYEGLYASARTGYTTEGGGESQRLQFGGGKTALDGRFKSVFGLEYLHRKPIYAFERAHTDSSLDAPTLNGRAAPRNYVTIDDFGQGDTTYIDPGSAVCDAFSSVGLSYQFRDPQGYYCGNTGWNANQSFRNNDNELSGYGEASYSYADEQEVYGFASFYRNRNHSLYSAPYWSSDLQSASGTIVDANRPDDFGIGGQAVTYQRLFTPDEAGSVDAAARRYREYTYELGVGLRGALADDYIYEAYASTARYQSRVAQRSFVTSLIEDYFLGQPTGEATGDLEGTGTFIYAPNMDRLNNPLTPAIYQSLTGISREKNFSQLQTLNASLTGPLADLPAGPMKFAAVVEWARQKYELRPDTGTLEGIYWGSGGTNGKGDRDRYAAGLELRAPIVEKLEGSLAARYDLYDDVTKVDGAVTYNAGLEYRPVQSLLLRGSAASSFRAPDMHYIFVGQTSYFAVVDDYYKCRKYQGDTPLEDCDYAGTGVSGTSSGNEDLKEEKGKSYTLGVFWDIAPKVSVSIDYYDIKLKDAVGFSSIDSLLRDEADCRLGETEDGTPVDINSGTCQAALAGVGRGPDVGSEDGETLLSVSDSPINQSYLRTKGIDVAGNAGVHIGRFGDLTFTLSYNNVLSYKTRQYPDEPTEDDNNTLVNGTNDLTTYHTRTNGSVSWDIDKWDFTVFVTRQGSIPSHRGGRKLSGEMRTNASIAYDLTENATVTLSGNNIFNQMPPHDNEETTYPYFDIYHYDVIGRELFLQVDMRF